MSVNWTLFISKGNGEDLDLWRRYFGSKRLEKRMHFCLFLCSFFFLGHFHVINRRSKKEEEEEKSTKKKQQQWRREKKPFKSDEKRERIIK